MSHLNGIAFESPEVQLQKLRERLRLMSDEELVKFGKMVRGLAQPRVSVMPDPWKEQLQEARAEWSAGIPKHSEQTTRKNTKGACVPGAHMRFSCRLALIQTCDTVDLIVSHFADTTAPF